MALQFTRMTGLTVGSMACFKVAAMACASTGVGLAVGAVLCITLGVLDHFIFKEDPDKVLEKEYQKLRKDVIDKAYAMFGLEEHCSDEELREARNAALRKYHSDRNQEDKTDDVTKAILTAYTLLKTVRSSK